jgi:2-keto-4-pentenoate hydratase
MLDAAICGKLARQLDEARRLRREIEPLSKTITELDLDDAYRIRRVGIGLRVARGEAIAAYKMGLTSKAKREQMGLAQSVYGVLMDEMRISDGAEFQVARAV